MCVLIFSTTFVWNISHSRKNWARYEKKCVLAFFHILYVLYLINVCMVEFLFNTEIYVFLLSCLFILIVCLCIFIVPAGTLRPSWLRFFLAFSPNARVKSAKMGHGPHSSQILVLFYVLFVLCRSVYCLCVNVYCTTATGWLPNCTEQIYRYIDMACKVPVIFVRFE